MLIMTVKSQWTSVEKSFIIIQHTEKTWGVLYFSSKQKDTEVVKLSVFAL